MQKAWSFQNGFSGPCVVKWHSLTNSRTNGSKLILKIADICAFILVRKSRFDLCILCKSSYYAICSYYRVPFLKKKIEKGRVCNSERNKKVQTLKMRINHCFVAGNSFECGNNGIVQIRKSSIHFIFRTFLTCLKKVEISIHNYYMPGIII